MEIWSIGFLFGVVVCLIVFMAVLYGRTNDVERSDKRELDRDSDVRIYVPNRSRDRRSDIGLDSPEEITDEEMCAVLGYYRIGATSYERRVIDKIIERIDDYPLGYCPHQE